MNQTVLDELAAKIEARIGGRRRGNEIVFSCPNPSGHKHGDAHPSARWSSPKRAWHCPVCNLGGGALDLAKRLGIEVPRPSRADGPECPPGVPAKWDGAPIRSLYTYQAADGRTLGHVARYQKDNEPKQIIPFFKREGDKRMAGAAPEPRPLYGLDRIAQAPPDAAIWIVEGEKCADALTGLGVVATTSPGGARGAESRLVAAHRAPRCDLA